MDAWIISAQCLTIWKGNFGHVRIIGCTEAEQAVNLAEAPGALATTKLTVHVANGKQPVAFYAARIQIKIIALLAQH